MYKMYINTQVFIEALKKRVDREQLLAISEDVRDINYYKRACSICGKSYAPVDRNGLIVENEGAYDFYEWQERHATTCPIHFIDLFLETGIEQPTIKMNRIAAHIPSIVPGKTYSRGVVLEHVSKEEFFQEIEIAAQVLEGEVRVFSATPVESLENSKSMSPSSYCELVCDRQTKSVKVRYHEKRYGCVTPIGDIWHPLVIVSAND